MSAAGSDQAAPDSGTVDRLPCVQIADYLSEFSIKHPDLAVDRGNGEFLSAAIGRGGEQSEPDSRPISVIPNRQFDSISKALQFLDEDVDVQNVERQVEQHGFFELGSVFLHDARLERFRGTGADARHSHLL